MNILLLEPYDTGSHQAWANGLVKFSQHNVGVLSLSGHFWKWRMHGGAVTLARRFLESDFAPDLLLATDMLDLTTFLSLTRSKTADIPTAIYFHENQLTYPWSPSDRDVLQNRDHHYGFVNFVSALSADRVFFNSSYHLESFVSELPRFLNHFPDYNELESVELIKAKSSVLPLGLDLMSFDEFKHRVSKRIRRPPLILWNHRWEYDKNPDEFFRALFDLAEQGVTFDVAIVGECFSQKPEIFNLARERLGSRVIEFGFVDRPAYASLLWQADVLPVTSFQDFFGASVVEAVYCGCFPLLPDRLAYPGLIPRELHSRHLYENFGDLVDKLKATLSNRDSLKTETLQRHVKKFAWQKLIAEYDQSFARIAESRGRRTLFGRV